MTDLDYIYRLLLAVVCGLVIGIERKTRLKEAGIRTHTIVSVGSALMMIISKYGFSDVAGGGGDGSRVAAQIVSGIGFLGAGMIFYKREALHGLTTAAGIWATAGVGMAMGAGMLVLSGAATIIIVSIQIVMHLPIKFLSGKVYHIIMLEIDECEGAIKIVKELFCVKRFMRFKTEKTESGYKINIVMRTSMTCDADTMVANMKKYPFIRTFERLEEV